MSKEISGHSHSHSETSLPITKTHSKYLFISVLAILVIAILGAIITFPSNEKIDLVKKKTREVIDFAEKQVPAKVDAIENKVCDGQENLPKQSQNTCRYVYFDLTNGKVKAFEGDPCIKNQPFTKKNRGPLRYCVKQAFQLESKTAPKFKIGQKVSLSYRSDDGIDPQYRYQYADQDRRIIIFLVVILFLLAVFIFGYWRGLLAVVGLVVSLLVIGFYILPALVAGENGMIVALSGGTLVAAAALYIAHGINSSTHVAFISSIGAVLTIALLSQIFFTLGRFSGFVSEEASYLAVSGSGIDIRGLLVAGVILASLGALDDMTVTQVAVVSEIHNARPDYKFSKIWKSSVRVGRDHVASTVNTLALAYVGTSLAVMILFVVSNQQLLWIANSESIAVEILGALIGSIGLIIAVPLSTAVAAYIVHNSDEHLHEDIDHNMSEDDSSAGSKINKS